MRVEGEQPSVKPDKLSFNACRRCDVNTTVTNIPANTTTFPKKAVKYHVMASVKQGAREEERTDTKQVQKS